MRCNFLYFDCYRAQRHFFGIIETLVTVLCGVMDGWLPSTVSGCHNTALCASGTFVVFLLVLVVLRPYASIFNACFAYWIAGMQCVSALSVSYYHFINTDRALDIGGYVAVAGMYALSVKAFIDLAMTAWDLVAVKLPKLCQGDLYATELRSRHADANDDPLGVLLLPVEGTQTALGKTRKIVIRGPHPAAALPNPLLDAPAVSPSEYNPENTFGL